jgi:hypothetical protein
MKIVYLSGPITGVSGFQEKFAAAEQVWQDMGHAVINPCHAFSGETNLTQEQYMRFHIGSILAADEMAMLPGWALSKGASFEEHMARMIGMPVHYSMPD